MAALSVYFLRSAFRASTQQTWLRPLKLRCAVAPFAGSRPLFTSQALVASTTSAAEHKSHNHVWHWNAERAVSISLLGLIPAAFIFPSPLMDCAVALSLTVHSHWGVEAIVMDYVREGVFGPVIPKVAPMLVYFFSFLTLGSLCYFNYTDCGMTNAVKLLWKL